MIILLTGFMYWLLPHSTYMETETGRGQLHTLVSSETATYRQQEMPRRRARLLLDARRAWWVHLLTTTERRASSGRHLLMNVCVPGPMRASSFLARGCSCVDPTPPSSYFPSTHPSPPSLTPCARFLSEVFVCGRSQASLRIHALLFRAFGDSRSIGALRCRLPREPVRHKLYFQQLPLGDGIISLQPHKRREEGDRQRVIVSVDRRPPMIS